MGTGFNFRG